MSSSIGPFRVSRTAGNRATGFTLSLATPFIAPHFLSRIVVRSDPTPGVALTAVSGTLASGSATAPGAARLDVGGDVYNRVATLVGPPLKAFTVHLEFTGTTVSNMRLTDIMPALARSAVLVESVDDTAEAVAESDPPPPPNEPSYEGNEAAVAFRSS